jgi:putative exporter of polyketide antibiotics
MSENVYVTIEEHKEFVHRVDSANEEQNRRISKLEESFEQITKLTVAVEKIAISLDLMVKEQEKQGMRLEAIEKQPAKRWDTLIACLITGIVGAAISAVASGFFH